MPSPTTWDTSGTYASLLLSSLSFSDDNTIVTATENQSQVCALNAITTGQYIIEFSLNSAANNCDIAVGICSTSWSVSDGSTVWANYGAGGVVDTVAGSPTQYVCVNGSSTRIELGAGTTPDTTIVMAVDATNRLIWFQYVNGEWNGSSTANPATGVGGIDFSGLTGAIVPVVGFQTASGSPAVTINAGPNMFVNAPTGFTGWPASGSTGVDASLYSIAGTGEEVLADTFPYPSVVTFEKYWTYDGNGYPPNVPPVTLHGNGAGAQNAYSATFTGSSQLILDFDCTFIGTGGNPFFYIGLAATGATSFEATVTWNDDGEIVLEGYQTSGNVTQSVVSSATTITLDADFSAGTLDLLSDGTSLASLTGIDFVSNSVERVSLIQSPGNGTPIATQLNSLTISGPAPTDAAKVSKQVQAIATQPVNAVSKQNQFVIEQPLLGVSRQTQYVVEEPIPGLSKQVQMIVILPGTPPSPLKITKLVEYIVLYPSEPSPVPTNNTGTGITTYIPGTTIATDGNAYYRMLDENADYILGFGSANWWGFQTEGVAQSALTRLWLNAGDWYINTAAGTPWNTQILGKSNPTTRDLILKSRIIGTPYVTTLVSYSSNVTQQRQYQVTATITTTFSADTITIADVI